MKKQIPFDFLLDYLPANVVIRPAIGMYYIYWGEKDCSNIPASHQKCTAQWFVDCY